MIKKERKSQLKNKLKRKAEKNNQINKNKLNKGNKSKFKNKKVLYLLSSWINNLDKHF
jgi:hypothetical protein